MILQYVRVFINDRKTKHNLCLLLFIVICVIHALENFVPVKETVLRLPICEPLVIRASI